NGLHKASRMSDNLAQLGSMVYDYSIVGKVSGNVCSNIIILIGQHPVGTVNKVYLSLLEVGEGRGAVATDNTRSYNHYPFGKTLEGYYAIGVDDMLAIHFKARVFTGSGSRGY